MNFKICLLSFFMLAFTIAQAQNTKVVTAYNYLKYYDQDKTDKEALTKAKEAIDEAAVHESTSAKGKTWYYRGIVYQNLSQDSVLQSQYPDAVYEAVKSYRKALDVGDDRFKDQEAVLNNLRLTTILLHNGGVEAFRTAQYERALNNFSTIIELKEFLGKHNTGKDVDVQAAMLNAALAAERLGKTDIAKKHFEGLVNINYDNPAIYQSLANLYKAEGDTATALITLKKGISKHPDNIGLYIDELNIYLASGRQKEAVGQLEQAIKLDSTNAQLYYALGVAYDNLKEKVKAVVAYQNALRIKPDYFDVYNNLGALYYNQAIEINEQINALPLTAQKQYDALSKQRNDLYEKALPYFEKAAQIEPDNVSMLNALKEIYAKMGNYEKSKEMKARIAKAQGE